MKLLPVLGLAILLASVAATTACSSDDDGNASPSTTNPDGGAEDDDPGPGSTGPGSCTDATKYAPNTDIEAMIASGSRIAWVQHDQAGDADKGVWVATLPGAPQHLTNATEFANSIAIDGDTLFYGDQKGLWSIPFAGGTPTQIAFDSAAGVVVDADRLYWQGSSSFKTLPRGQVDTDGTKVEIHSKLGSKTNVLAGGFLYQMEEEAIVRVPVTDLDATPTVVIDGRNELETFLVDGDTIYAFDRKNATNGDVIKLPIAGGAATVIGADLLVPASPRLALAGGNIFVSGLLQTYQVPTAGGAVRERFCPGGAFALVVSGSTLVWSDEIDGGIYTAPLP